MQIKRNRTHGFTLVEIMIVVAIIGLLAAIAIPNFVKARQNSQVNACLNNLRQIDGAKQQWALENGKTNGDTPGSADIQAFLGRGSAGSVDNVYCPLDTTKKIDASYTLGNLATAPVCQKDGTNHLLK